jgi:hypothetical protein
MKEMREIVNLRFLLMWIFYPVGIISINISYVELHRVGYLIFYNMPTLQHTDVLLPVNIRSGESLPDIPLLFFRVFRVVRG